ncbi:DUF3592 domain-containing protein [uncultured Zobellia sp.]|uniref:DUF3592 domain-containing protein n=1 Tax=uncultured Zobellia sp. TaxID=255433 RepID=UPI00338F2E7D
MTALMKISLLVLLSALLYWPLSAQNTSENWIETKAKITEIHNNIKARGTRSFATVSYMDEDGNQYKSRVELLAIPFIGTLKSVNDSVTIYYDSANPTLAKSPETSFIQSYGLYLLIGLGILFSLYNFRKKMGSNAT